MATRTVTASPRGWSSWTVTALAGDRIRATITAQQTGWAAITDSAYAYLTAKPRFTQGVPLVLEHTVTKAGTYRVGVSTTGPVTVVIDVTPPVTPHWDRPGPFTTASFWRDDLSTAPLHENSDAIVADLTAQITPYWGGIAALNVTQFATSHYQVPGDQPRVRVQFNDAQKKGYTPSSLYDTKIGAFLDVPIPDDAVPAAGTDGHLAIWCPATDQLWEFWKAKRLTDGTWTAVWGGRIDAVSVNPGWFPAGLGASATGVATARGSIGMIEAQAGTIDHALSLVALRVRRSLYSWPAQRTDGDQPDGLVVEGQRLRLDPAVDVPALGLTPIGQMVALAAQRYGFIVTDKGGAVAVSVESGAGAKAATGTDPWTTLLGTAKAYNVLRGFPWHRLQAMPHDYGRPA